MNDIPQTSQKAKAEEYHPAFHSVAAASVRQWMFLNVWCRWLYRPTMRILHRLGLHYTRISPMSPTYGKQEHWCEWCGLRGSTYKPDPSKGINQCPCQPSPEPIRKL